MATTSVPQYLTSHLLAGERLVYSLDHEAQALGRGLDENTRRGVTLAKQGGLSVVLVQMKAGNRLDEHSAPGPTTVLNLAGRVRLRVGTEEVLLLPHDIVVFGPGARHDAVAEQDSTLLITVGSQSAGTA